MGKYCTPKVALKLVNAESTDLAKSNDPSSKIIEPRPKKMTKSLSINAMIGVQKHHSGQEANVSVLFRGHSCSFDGLLFILLRYTIREDN